MKRRSRRNKPISMLGAFLVEAGTMLAIVALAQPTWTRNFIEQFGPLPPVSADAAVNNLANNSISTSAGILAGVLPAKTVAFAAEPASGVDSTRSVLHSSVSGQHRSVSGRALPAQENINWQRSAPTALRPLRPSVGQQSASDMSQRLAMADWSAPSMSANAYAAPQYSHYSADPYATQRYYSTNSQVDPRTAIRPIYPPPASSQSMPAWSNSY